MNTSCLELFCQYKGYQGGTIHQAIDEFAAMQSGEQDRFCNLLMDKLDNIADLHNVQVFMQKRLSARGLQIINC